MYNYRLLRRRRKSMGVSTSTDRFSEAILLVQTVSHPTLKNHPPVLMVYAHKVNFCTHTNESAQNILTWHVCGRDLHHPHFLILLLNFRKGDITLGIKNFCYVFIVWHFHPILVWCMCLCFFLLESVCVW